MRLRCLPVVLAILNATGASATPTRLAESNSINSKASRMALQSFARCVTNPDPTEAYDLVRTTPESAQEADAFSALTSPINKCASKARGLKIMPGRSIFRGYLAEQIWFRWGDVITWWRSGTDPASLNYSSYQNVVGLRDVYEAAFCVAKIDPIAIQTLLRTSVGSKAENKVIQEVVPVLRRCLREGSSLNLQMLVLRPILAEQLLRQFPPYRFPGSGPGTAPLLNPPK